MKHGRIVRVTPYRGAPDIFYVVAEENRFKAANIIRAISDPGAKVEPISRASLKLILAMSLSEGQFRETTP
jgi:hypothetical protein